MVDLDSLSPGSKSPALGLAESSEYKNYFPYEVTEAKEEKESNSSDFDLSLPSFDYGMEAGKLAEKKEKMEEMLKLKKGKDTLRTVSNDNFFGVRLKKDEVKKNGTTKVAQPLHPFNPFSSITKVEEDSDEQNENMLNYSFHLPNSLNNSIGGYGNHNFEEPTRYSTLVEMQEEEIFGCDSNEEGKSSPSSTIEESDYKRYVNWNSDFQKASQEEDQEERSLKMAEVIKNFHFNAQKYGEIIISEKFIPPAMKTIKPVSIGGVAGGEKYVVHGEFTFVVLEAWKLSFETVNV